MYYPECNLLVLEGLDGSGKATQAQSLYLSLKRIKKYVHKVSFPNYESKSSDLIRTYLNSNLSKNEKKENIYAISSLFAFDRYLSYVNSWKEFYKAGNLIIADRYSTSNAVYQLSNIEKDKWDDYLNWLEDYEYCKLELPKPKLVIYLDMPVNISQKLMLKRYNGDESRKDLYEKDVERLKRCREAAMYVSKKYNWKIIDCVDEITGKIKSVSEIHEIIFNLVEKTFF